MKAVTLTAGSALRLELALDAPRFGMGPDRLFSLALRNNPNRAFLFVSRVLGKHIPIRPAALPAAGKLLSLALEGAEDPGVWPEIAAGEEIMPFPAVMEALEADQITLGPEERTLFVGFAETATGLAQATAACYTGESAYISTTRLPLEGREPLTFEESHSHAKTHLLHLDVEEPFLKNCRRAVLIDDEFTTGRTALKLAEVLCQRFGIRRFVLLSLLDWTDGSACRAMAGKLGADIQMVSLLHGSIARVETAPLEPPALEDWRGRTCPKSPMRFTLDGPGSPPAGRTLLSPQAQAEGRRICQERARLLEQLGPDTLFLGTGECIYAPALIAGYCNAAAFHSTTQSPVYPLPGSAVDSGLCFDAPDCYSPVGYVYNIPQGRYRRAVILAEPRCLPVEEDGLWRLKGLDQLVQWLQGRGCEQVEVVPL